MMKSGCNLRRFVMTIILLLTSALTFCQPFSEYKTENIPQLSREQLKFELSSAVSYGQYLEADLRYKQTELDALRTANEKLIKDCQKQQTLIVAGSVLIVVVVVSGFVIGVSNAR